MNKKITALLCSLAFGLCTAGTAGAQGSPPWRIVPVDIWTCNFTDGNDMSDLDDWVDRFNAWADEQEDDTYAAWTMTPAYFGPDQQWDFLWLGAWQDGNAMGQGWDLWNGTNDGLMNRFLAMASCDAHGNFASAAYRIPDDYDASGSGVLAVSDCKIHDGANSTAVDRATRQWVDVLDQEGSNLAMFHWYPVFGGGAADFDYKEVTVYNNYADLGADYERMGNGGLYQQGQALLEHLVSCDDARVYNVQNRRYVDLRGGQ